MAASIEGIRMKKIPLVLLPGLLCDADLWEPQVDALLDLVEPTVGDLTGHDSIAALAADVLRQAPPGRFALAGFSLGGYVAQEVMRAAPERVRALALLDTTARPDTPESTANRRRFMLQAETDFAAVLEAQLPRLLTEAQLGDPGIAGVIRNMGAALGKDVFIRQQTAIIGRIDSRPHLAAIRCPTLVLCGALDQITPVAVHEEMAAAIAGARLVVVPGAAHVSTLGQPEAVNAALRQWLVEAMRG